MGKGRRIVAMADAWTAILDRQQRPAPAPAEPIQPSQHVCTQWAASTWDCPCQRAGDARPTERIVEPQEREQ